MAPDGDLVVYHEDRKGPVLVEDVGAGRIPRILLSKLQKKSCKKTLGVGGNQPLYHPYFLYRRPFAWYHQAQKTDVHTDVREVGFLPPKHLLSDIVPMMITKLNGIL